MILKNGTMNEVFLATGKNDLYLFGAGSRAESIYQKCGGLFARGRIKGIIDNDPEKQKKGFARYGTEKIPVISKAQFFSRIDRYTAILFTPENFWEPFWEFDGMEELRDTVCYVYSLIQMEEWEPHLYDEGLPETAIEPDRPIQIPKKIHYCWFGGGGIPDRYKKYLESWERFCPDYEIIRWDESNYDVEKNPYMSAAYQDKKWAFVSDYARIDVIYEHGGVYLDTDVELIRPIDILLTEKAYAGFESMSKVNFGLGYGSVAGNPILKDILQLYGNLEWDGGKTACPCYQTMVLERHGLIPENRFQRLADMTILPVRCLCGKSINSRRERRMRDTFSIHHFAGTWTDFPEEEKRIRELRERAVYDS